MGEDRFNALVLLYVQEDIQVDYDKKNRESLYLPTSPQGMTSMQIRIHEN